MNLDKFKDILLECHIDDPALVTPDLVESMYHDLHVADYPTDEYLCLAVPDEQFPLIILALWVTPEQRNQGTATKILESIPLSHGMVVDYRSEAMHNLLLKLDYKVQDYFTAGNERVPLEGGDLFYYKEIS